MAIVIGQGGGDALRALATLTIVAALSKTDYGIYTAAFALVDPLRALSVIGLDPIAMRRSAMRPDLMPAYLGTLAGLRLGLAVIVFTVAVVVAFATRSGEPGGVAPIAAAATTIVSLSLLKPRIVAFQARQRVERVVSVPIASAVAQVLYVFALAAVGVPVFAYAFTPVVGDAVGLVVLRRLLSLEVGAPLTFSAPIARELVRDALPMAYEQVVVVFYGRLGFYILQTVAGLGAVAELGLATKLVEPILFLAGAFSISIAPYAARLTSEGGYEEFRRFFGRLIRRALVALTPVGLLTFFLAEPVIVALRPEYQGAALALRWLGFGACVMFFCQVTSACLLGLGRVWLIAAMATFNLILYLTLALQLVPRLGAEGAAIATLAMETVNAVAQVSIVLYLLSYHSRRPPRAR